MGFRRALEAGPKSRLCQVPLHLLAFLLHKNSAKARNNSEASRVPRRLLGLHGDIWPEMALEAGCLDP